ncbi:hypothetical protein LCGC14_1622530 [marine sediment metagenome]|uniref:Metallopeptidase domain-containing protein n=1 Tax=marine sediment metagenome TaxID=412755 RepID=A0A0F9I5A0_9ZZZZ
MTLTLEKLARRQAIVLGWHHPFFAIPSARVRFREDKSGHRTTTACVSADGWIYLYAPWCSTLSTEELRGLIAHEIMHLLMRHREREGTRIHDVWGISTDMTINRSLRASAIVLPHGDGKDGVYPPIEWETWHAERIYDELIQQGQKARSAEDGPPMPGQGCGVMDPTGEGAGGDDDGDSSDRTHTGVGASEADLSRRWREIAVQAAEMGRTQGAGKDDALVGALEIPQPRVRWSSILRRGISTAIAAHGRDTQTWSRRGRRSQAIGPQFAGWQTTAAKCAVVIDTSGSMGDDDLAQCVAEVVAISRESGVSIYLVTHDHGVQWAGWIVSNCTPTAIKPALTGRGGTNAHEAYVRVQGAAQRFDAFVHLTDGYLGWPEWPRNTRQKIVALTGYSVDPSNVPDGAQVVEVNTTGN